MTEPLMGWFSRKAAGYYYLAAVAHHTYVECLGSLMALHMRWVMNRPSAARILFGPELTYEEQKAQRWANVRLQRDERLRSKALEAARREYRDSMRQATAAHVTATFLDQLYMPKKHPKHFLSALLFQVGALAEANEPQRALLLLTAMRPAPSDAWSARQLGAAMLFWCGEEVVKARELFHPNHPASNRLAMRHLRFAGMMRTLTLMLVLRRGTIPFRTIESPAFRTPYPELLVYHSKEPTDAS